MPNIYRYKIRCCAPLVLTGVALLCLAACRKSPPSAAARSEGPGQTVVFDSITKAVDPAALQGMRWQDIALTVEACFRNQLTEQTLAATTSLSEGPVIYLRGLLKFMLHDLDGAAGEWAKLDVTQIPADHLYAPWRLAFSKNETPNRYQSALSTAVANHQANPLVRARFLGSGDEYRETLEAYLQTDPFNVVHL